VKYFFLVKIHPSISGVQGSSDARVDCLVGCPPTKF